MTTHTHHGNEESFQITVFSLKKFNIDCNVVNVDYTQGIPRCVRYYTWYSTCRHLQALGSHVSGVHVHVIHVRYLLVHVRSMYYTCMWVMLSVTQTMYTKMVMQFVYRNTNIPHFSLQGKACEGSNSKWIRIWLLFVHVGWCSIAVSYKCSYIHACTYIPTCTRIEEFCFRVHVRNAGIYMCVWFVHSHRLYTRGFLCFRASLPSLWKFVYCWMQFWGSLNH